MLRELGYDVFYLHPLDRVFSVEVEDPDVKRLFLDLVRRTLEDEGWGRLAMAVFDLVKAILKKRRRKIAIIADDVFQSIGLDKGRHPYTGKPSGRRWRTNAPRPSSPPPALFPARRPT